jgi:hypothetical protein
MTCCSPAASLQYYLLGRVVVALISPTRPICQQLQPTTQALYAALTAIGELPLLQSHLYQVLFFQDSHQTTLADTACFKQTRLVLSLESYLCEILLVTEPMYQVGNCGGRRRGLWQDSG